MAVKRATNGLHQWGTSYSRSLRAPIPAEAAEAEKRDCRGMHKRRGYAPGDAMKLRVYVVEDSAILSPVLRTLIEAVGAKVVGNSGAASSAIEDIKVLRPDAVIIDIGLRQGSGFDVLKALSVNSAGHRPKRIVLTNHTLDQYRKAAQRWGADYFFDKSKEIPELLRILRDMPPQAIKA